MIKMPPQAYTKEVLAAAFDWLSNQPEYVRQKIASSDDLVGLYLKSTRLKNDFNKDLTSAKNFRNELQDLAQNLKQFEEKEEKPQATVQTRSIPIPMPKESGPSFRDEPAFQDSVSAMGAYSEGGINEAPTSGGPSSAAQGAPKFQFNPNQVVEPATAKPVSKQPSEAGATSGRASKLSEGEIIFKLDQKTLSALNLAKDRLNLSSDTEALRVLVSLGEKHLKKLFSSED